MDVHRNVERCLVLIRDRIRERGFTQLEVQESLGWGRSYISQLLTKQKKLRVEQVLLILSVIGIEPAEFFADLYAYPVHSVVRRAPSPPETDLAVLQLRQQLHAVTDLLLEKRLIGTDELSDAVRTAGGSSTDLLPED